jgi:hypothetical protein
LATTAVEEAGMSTGVFSLMCPRCGDDLHTGAEGVEACEGCGSVYVERFGYLFPHRVITPDPTTAAPGATTTSPN